MRGRINGGSIPDAYLSKKLKAGDTIKPWAEHFYKSTAWTRCRDAYFVSQHGLCERCSQPGKIVHHKEYLTPDNINNPDVTLNWDKLELLCQDCHNKEHFKDTEGSVREGLMFDEYGELVQTPP